MTFGTSSGSNPRINPSVSSPGRTRAYRAGSGTRQRNIPSIDKDDDLTLQQKAVSDLKTAGKFGATVARDIFPGTLFQIASIVEKVPYLASRITLPGVVAGKLGFKAPETHVVDDAWQATQRWINPLFGLDESYVDDLTDISRSTEAARKAGQAGLRNPGEFAKQAGISGFWALMSVAGIFDVVGATGAISGTARGLKRIGKAKGTVDFGSKGLDATTKAKVITGQAKLSPSALLRRASNLEQTELIKLTGASRASEDAATQLSKTLSGNSDRGVKSATLPLAIKESQIAAKEAMIESGNYLPIPKQIDSIRIDPLEIPAEKFDEVTGLEKSAVISHNAFAKAFNTISESSTARALNAYNKEEYVKFFDDYRIKFQEVAEHLVRQPEALTNLKIRQLRLELDTLKRGIKNGLGDLAARTNFNEGVVKGLTVTKRKKLLEKLRTTASEEIDGAVNNAFKIVGSRRKAIDIDAELLADVYIKKLDDLKDGGIPVKVTKKQIKGHSVANATLLQNPEKALRDAIFKNYATAVRNSVLPYIEKALKTSNVLDDVEKAARLKDAKKFLSDFRKGELNAEQLNGNLNATLVRNGASVLNEGLVRKEAIGKHVEELVRGYNLDGPMHSSAYDAAKTKKIVKTVKETQKQFEAKIKAVGQEAALDTPEHIAFSNAVNDYGEALNLQHFSYRNLRDIDDTKKVGRLTVGPFVTAVKKVVKGESGLVDATINTLYADAFNAAQIIKKFTLADGKVQPLIADTLVPAIEVADVATDAAKNLNRTTIQTIDTKLREHLKSAGVKGGDLFRKGTLSHHAQWYSGLLLENLTSSKLDFAKLSDEKSVKKIREIAGALTRSLKEHGVDTTVTLKHVQDYANAVDNTSEATRMASKRKAMHAFRKDVLGMEEGVEKIFDDTVYPYLQETRGVYNTKVKDGYSILYGEGAPQDFDFYYPLWGKDGNLADETTDISFLDVKGLMAEGGDASKGISTDISQIHTRNEMVSEKAYLLNGEQVYSTSTEQLYRFAEAAPVLEQARGILKTVTDLNEDVRHMLEDHLSKVIKQKEYKETAVDAFLRWNAGLRVATFLSTPQFAGGTWAARGVESVAGINDVGQKFQAHGKRFLKENKDYDDWVTNDLLVNRLDQVDISRVDTQMAKKMDSQHKTTIRGSIGSKERLANIGSGINTGLGQKILGGITKMEDKMKKEVAMGMLLERWFKKIQKADPSVDIKNIPAPKSLDEFTELITDADKTAVYSQLDELYGAHDIHRRSTASASADGITSMMTLMASWSLRNKQRLGTAFMRDKVKKEVGNEFAEKAGLTFDNAPSFWEALLDMIESEGTYQLGRITTKQTINELLGTAGSDPAEDFNDSIRSNLLSNAVSVGWAGQQISEPVIDLINGYGAGAFENITEPLSPVIKSGNLAEAASKGLEHWTFIGNALLSDSGVLSPFTKMISNVVSTDAADSNFKSELRQIFRQSASTSAGLAAANKYFASGSKISRPYSTVELSTFNDPIKAKEEILRQALSFHATNIFEKAFGSADNRRLSQIKSPSKAVKQEGEVARNLRSLHTLLLMSDSEWLTLREYANDVATETGKSSWRNQVNSWDRFRNSHNGKINKYAVRAHLDDMLRAVEYKSGDRERETSNFLGRADRGYFGSYGKYQRGIESILGGL